MAMERVLSLYHLPYDPLYPVVCFDERPCFLIGEVLQPIEMKSRQVKKQHYAYEKNGSCVLMAAIEPLTGKRLAKVYKRRTKKEYADFMQVLSQYFTDALRIRLVQDNLNTHCPSAFYENIDAQQAQALDQRFEWHYTPKAGSWLNMIEIEFSALAKQCLNRRIPTQEQLEKEVLAIVKERAEKKSKLTGNFPLIKPEKLWIDIM